jgi:hypothetical protein
MSFLVVLQVLSDRVMKTSMEKARLYSALAAAITLQLFVLYYQRNYGALVGLIPWDDCLVVLRGLENLDKFAQAHSLWHMMGAARHLDIHAPVSDIQSTVGLLFSPGAMWGPYALNLIYLCIAIYAISTAVALRDTVFFVASVMFLLVQPITFSALAELKSDWQGGLLMGAALFVLFDSAEANNDQGRVIASGLLGLMLVTKMTAFYLPVLTLGVFLVFELYRGFKHQLAIKGPSTLWLARPQTVCVALILIPYLAFFYYSHEALLAYIHNALGPLYTDGLTISERLLYYSRGTPWHLYSPILGKDAPWGGLHFTFFTFLSAALIAALFRRAWLHVLACAGVLAIAAAFLAPLALAHTSNMSFGAPFFGTLIGGTLIFMRIFAANTSRWGAVIAPIVMLVLALPSELPLSPIRDLTGVPVERSRLEHYQSIYDDMADRIARQATPAEPKVGFAFELFVAPYPNLSIRFFQRTGHFLSTFRIDDFANSEANSLLADADFMVTIMPTGGTGTVPNVGGNFPTSTDPALGDARVRASGRYELASSYQVQGGEIRLYQAELLDKKSPNKE